MSYGSTMYAYLYAIILPLDYAFPYQPPVRGTMQLRYSVYCGNTLLPAPSCYCASHYPRQVQQNCHFKHLMLLIWGLPAGHGWQNLH